MQDLVETKLQKFILFIGGLSVFFRLLNTNYYERYNIIFTSVGISILTIVLLILLRGYHPKFHLKSIDFIRRYRRFFGYFTLLVISVILAWGGPRLNQEIKSRRLTKVTNEKFHSAEVAYQKCLDKVASVTSWKLEKSNYIPISQRNEPFYITRGINKYFDEWVAAGRPNYNMQKGHWEWAFMEWMIEKHTEFCQEYDTDLISYFLEQKEIIFPDLSSLPELPNRFRF